MNAPQSANNNRQTHFDASIHGVLIDVFDLGVLLTGPSGIGKSEVALGLISRQHKLIADDCVYFKKNAGQEIIGFSPALLQDFIEVRGLGILNMRAMFGDQALMSHKRLDMIVHIEDAKKITENQSDRLFGMRTTETILGVPFDKVTIPVAPGRNLAILVEVAVRNQRLIHSGYISTEVFLAKQAQLVNETTVQ